jgi:hydrogenase expression/formation protein HypE
VSLHDSVRLEHGSGGALSRDLVENVIYPSFRSDSFPELLDAGAVEPGSDFLLTTDGYVVDPPFFPGGDIGKLAVCGTCNDLSVSGARPLCLSLALVIEEGFSIELLRRAMTSASDAASAAGARVVTGDTKVVPRGKGGGLFITSTGVGRREFRFPLSPRGIEAGDGVIVSGPIGAHGLTVLAARESLPVGDTLRSDAANLYPAVSALFPLGNGLHFMRDATRGGVSSVLNEMVQGGRLGIVVQDDAFPVSPDVRTVCGLLGLSPLEIANEGVFVAVVAAKEQDRALQTLQKQPLGREARLVGTVSQECPGRVLATTRVGGTRVVDFPRGLLLPRIC